MFLEWENNSGKFQNNAVNDVKQISLSHVIIVSITWNCFQNCKGNIIPGICRTRVQWIVNFFPMISSFTNKVCFI